MCIRDSTKGPEVRTTGVKEPIAYKTDEQVAISGHPDTDVYKRQEYDHRLPDEDTNHRAPVLFTDYRMTYPRLCADTASLLSLIHILRYRPPCAI